MTDTSYPEAPPGRWTLRQLPFAARLTLAAFLVSVGIGYFSALVQLHFQHAGPGELMPTSERAINLFHGPTGKTPQSRLVRLVAADEKERFNGTGQMSAAFFNRSEDFKSDVKSRAKANHASKSKEEGQKLAESEVRAEREGERKAVLYWLEKGADRDAYQRDKLYLPEELKDLHLTKKYANTDDEGRFIQIKTLFTERCVCCHIKEGGSDANAAAYPLESYEQIAAYNKVETSTAMSLTKLAQTTHVHLLGFSMLYGLTGLIFALTGYPALLRFLIAPLPLIAQVADISFWWLARLDAPYGPMFATWIPISGGVVGAGLALQIILSLFGLFNAWGKLLLVALFAAAGAGGMVVKDKVVDPHMAREKAAVEAVAPK